jgi:hypothetical protein
VRSGKYFPLNPLENISKLFQKYVDTVALNVGAFVHD